MYDNNYNDPRQAGNMQDPYNGYPGYGHPGAPLEDPSRRHPKKTGGFGKKAASVVCLGLVFGITSGTAFSVPAYMTARELKETKLEIEEMQASLKGNTSAPIATTADPVSASNTAYSSGASANVSAIAANCLPSVVSITNKGVTEVRTMFGTYQQNTEGSGSGIIIGENDTELLIVTNHHVVSGSSELSVVFSYDEDSDNPSLVSAKIKGYDADKDLAVIAVALDDITDEMRSKIKIATVGDSSDLVLGQEVVAIGNALGYGQSVTTGIISALNREVTVADDKGNPITNRLIQTDAAINPGNSGGALLNMQGELIGINSVKVSSSSVEGMGYAIPISDVQSIIEELMLKESRDAVAKEAQGYLGINCIDVTNEIYEAYDMPVGVYVYSVQDDSPAKAAGLVKGNIITKFDGQTIKTREELVALLTYYRAGETVDVTAMVQGTGGYTEQTFQVTLGTKDVLEDSAQDAQQAPSQDAGQGRDSFMDPFGSFWSIP